MRAPTPSGAAELVAPDWRELAQRARMLESRIGVCAEHALERTVARGEALERRLLRMHPGFVLRQHGQRQDELVARLARSVLRTVRLRGLEAAHARNRLRRATPRALLARRHGALTSHQLRLAGAARDALALAGGRLALAATSLHAFSPLRTLERGYAIVKDAGTGRVIRSGRELEPGQAITGTLAEGGFDAVVSRTR